MKLGKKLPLCAITLLFVFVTFAVPSVNAKGNEYDAVCDHIEKRYKAKKVKIPFMWLARMAVGIVKPAGVKAFKVTIYRNLDISRSTLDAEMRDVMKNAFDDEWSPILRVVSREGEQVYMNMREYRRSVKILLVVIDRDEAVVVRARFNPEKLAEFINDPKIFGISLDGNHRTRKSPAAGASDPLKPDDGN